MDTGEGWRKRSAARHVGRSQVGAMVALTSWKVTRRLSMQHLLAVFLCCGVVVSLPGTLSAQSSDTLKKFLNGNQLYDSCKAEDYVHIGQCLGYITGAIDSWLVASNILHKDDNQGCVPDEVIQSQIRDVVIKY